MRAPVLAALLSCVALAACAPPAVAHEPTVVLVVASSPPAPRCDDVERVLVEDVLPMLEDAGFDQ